MPFSTPVTLTQNLGNVPTPIPMALSEPQAIEFDLFLRHNSQRITGVLEMLHLYLTRLVSPVHPS